jgi:hypothetical protein
MNGLFIGERRSEVGSKRVESLSFIPIWNVGIMDEWNDGFKQKGSGFSCS